jgi:hypothetical protein
MALMTLSLRSMAGRGDCTLPSGPTTVRDVPSAGVWYAPQNSGGPDPAAGGGRG